MDTFDPVERYKLESPDEGEGALDQMFGYVANVIFCVILVAVLLALGYYYHESIFEFIQQNGAMVVR